MRAVDEPVRDPLVGRLALWILGGPWLLTATGLLLVFHSWRGRLFALWLLASLAWLALRAYGRKATVLLLVLAAAAMALVAASWPGSAGQIQSHGSLGVLNRLTNLVPESDLTELGVRLFYPGSSGRLLELIRPLYAEMEADGEMGRLPHVVRFTASDLVGGATGAGHFYCFLPAGAPGRVPALLFLHGAMGNFQCYFHFWRQWAQPRGWAVICPTFGFGCWFKPGGEEAAVSVLRQALETLPIDPQRVTVAALSNGATGAVRLIRRCPDNIQFAVLVSPVLERSQFLSPEYRQWAAGHPAPLILEGDQDVNVHPASVESAVKAMSEAGLACDYRLWPGHDHFLLFSARQQVYQALSERLDSSGPARGEQKE